jgi:hypothetical protein
MKKVKTDDLRAEYAKEDLGQGVRGKYFGSYKKGTNLVLLNPDVAKAFPDEKAVNQALRSLIAIAQRTTGLEKRAKKPIPAPEHENSTYSINKEDTKVFLRDKSARSKSEKR